MSEQRYETALTDRLEKQIAHLKDEVCAGLLPDHAAYLGRCAQITAYRRVIEEFMGDVRKELAER